MDLKLFDFHLPTERIAQEPMRPRDHARLLHVPNDGSALRDLRVDALPGLLKDGDVMVFNDTRVIPARLVGKRGDAAHAGKPEGTKIEVTLHQPVDAHTWRVFAKPARKLQSARLSRVWTRALPRLALTRATWANAGLQLQRRRARALIAMLEKHRRDAAAALYQASQQKAHESDRDDYQTMFAENDGAVAAPTAALHFTDGSACQSVRSSGRHVDDRVTLTRRRRNSSAGARVEDTDDHEMHTERAILSARGRRCVERRAGSRWADHCVRYHVVSHTGKRRRRSRPLSCL